MPAYTTFNSECLNLKESVPNWMRSLKPSSRDKRFVLPFSVKCFGHISVFLRFRITWTWSTPNKNDVLWRSSWWIGRYWRESKQKSVLPETLPWYRWAIRQITKPSIKNILFLHVLLLFCNFLNPKVYAQCYVERNVLKRPIRQSEVFKKHLSGLEAHSQ